MNLVKPLVCFLVCSISFSLNAQQSSDDLKIWFSHPAGNWNEALPVGNGRLGAMVFGYALSERLQLNEETVWSGQPKDFVNPEAKAALPVIRKLLFDGKYAEAQKLAQEKMMGKGKQEASYQTLGDMLIDMEVPQNARENITNYRRELNLETAISKVVFTAGNTIYTREVFSSKPGEALLVRLTASRPGSLTFNLKLQRPGNKALIQYSDNGISLSEHTNNGIGVKLVSKTSVMNEGGTVEAKSTHLHIEKADAVTILLTANTNYWKGDPETLSQAQLSKALTTSYQNHLDAHIADYQKYFKRVDLDLGQTNATYFPTDTRLAALQSGNIDPQLIKLYYQFGRYLLISSSRPGDLPSNLQGIWSDGLSAPWSADYHININIQMNYWLAEQTNLSEMHQPFFDFINALRPDGRKTAKDMYGMKGIVAHYTTDAWLFTETSGNVKWAMWPMGLGWSAQHLWEHYLFTEDKKLLAQHYPIMKEAAEFYVSWLTENPVTKQLVSGPSTSPENAFLTKSGESATMVMGPTMDHMIIRDLFENTIAASKILRKDESFRRSLENKLTQLAPTRIGSDGRIMEWTEEFKEPEPGHRHISHLFGLHPGRQITSQKSPELLTAARKTIDFRLANGGGHTGWSRAWIINFFARLQDGAEAYKNLIALLQKSTLPNLFDTHPPFQIDGNFGATAGITEMLLQSHSGEVHVLPALPLAWQKGYIHGLSARGGFDIDIDWTEGRLEKLTVLSKLGNPCIIRYKDQALKISTVKGKSYTFDSLLRPL
ncbi:MAG: glycoside hydrolase family 95 protein [Sphingobacteriaceae bacterium]|nr:glycoside hydrolase family 95 protein [Sphingobacteriaceae bacterium]